MGRLFNLNVTSYIEQYDLKTFVETGTGEGDTLEHMLIYGFSKYHSIEIDPNIYNRCLNRFWRTPHVQLYNGSSYDKLGEILPTIPKDRGILYWLDAHFPGADSGFASYDAEKDVNLRIPLQAEIELIKQLRPNSKDVICIDDLRIYEDGPFQNGNWEDRATLGGDGIGFIYDCFAETHNIVKDYQDEGYIVITPKVL